MTSNGFTLQFVLLTSFISTSLISVNKLISIIVIDLYDADQRKYCLILIHLEFIRCWLFSVFIAASVQFWCLPILLQVFFLNSSLLSRFLKLNLESCSSNFCSAPPTYPLWQSVLAPPTDMVRFPDLTEACHPDKASPSMWVVMSAADWWDVVRLYMCVCECESDRDWQTDWKCVHSVSGFCPGSVAGVLHHGSLPSQQKHQKKEGT